MGTARHALHTLAADERTAHMRPLMLSTRGLRCVPADAEVLLEALRAAAEERFALPEWEAETEGLLVTLRSSGAEWMPRVWTELATVLLVEGITTVLVGTRKLLGESWVCASLNVLVDLTVAEAGASVQQMHGRTLRLDRGDPEKVASNWEVVCAAPDRVRGGVDYARFVRKQAQLFALTDEGTVESGPAHVHPELGSFAPPPAARFGAIDADQLARAADRATARERWQVGTPYLGVELPTLLVRALEAPGAPPLGLQDAGRVIAEAYRELGELSAEAAGSLRVRPAGAFRRCELTAATAAEGARFVAALDELCGPAPGRARAADLPAARLQAGARAAPARGGAGARDAGRFRPRRGARGGLRPRLGQAPGPGTCLRARGLAPARTGATRRWSERSGCRSARPGPRPRGPARRGRRRSRAAGARAPAREGRRRLLAGVAPGLEHGAPGRVSPQHDLERVGHVVEEGSQVA